VWHALLRFSAIFGAIAGITIAEHRYDYHTLLHARLLSFPSEIEVSRVDVHFFDGEAGHRAYALHDILAHRIGDLWDVDPIVNRHIQVYRCLALSDLNAYTTAPLIGPGKTSGEASNGGSRAHRDKVMHPINLTGGRRDDLRDNAIGDDRFPQARIQLDSIRLLRWDKRAIGGRRS
jgi:hypothetical protein